MEEKILQWFPGHMKKAERLIQDNLKLVDIVIELLDARIPLSSQNPMLREIIQDKPRLIVLTKADLAANVDDWLKKFRADDFHAVAVDSVKGSGIGLAVCDELVALHNGKLNIYSKLNEGTTVEIVLPLLQ